MDIEKEDGQSEYCICQLKSTDNKSISIKQDDLHILEYNAAISHKLPVFAFQFLNTDEVWVAIKETDIEAFKKLIQGIETKEKSIDIEEEQEYNIPVSGKAGKTMNARQAFYDKMLKERQKNREEVEKRMKERSRERREMTKQWQKRSLSKRG